MNCRICKEPIKPNYGSSVANRKTCGKPGCHDKWAEVYRLSKIQSPRKHVAKTVSTFNFSTEGKKLGGREVEMPLTVLLWQDGWLDYVGCNQPVPVRL